jgi:eukaryotic-like serine/threonine-protein kinase
MDKQTLLNSRYKIEDHIGSGGMADVYRARDLMLERTVAIKILREDLSSNSTFRERFRQEAKSAANLSHPSIVTIHDFGLDGGKLFLVMEYIPGADLKSVQESRGSFSVEEALPLLIQACAGLGYAHRSGLIHCDVKPHNMIVTPDSQLKITDFGIARALSTIHPTQQAEVVWGSPQYFSPEQASGLVLTPASDVYSLGVVMFEMLTGHLPFDAPTASELSLLHRTSAPPSPRRLNPQISPSLEEVILKVLSKEPSARYRTADQMGRVLMSFSHATSSLSTTTTIPPQRPLTANPPPQHFGQISPTPWQSRDTHIPSQNTSQSSPLDIDWVTWGLALLALLFVGGLIPLWLWVYLLYFPTRP